MSDSFSNMLCKECNKFNVSKEELFHSFVQSVQKNNKLKRQEKLGNISKYVLDMYKHLVALKDFEDKEGQQQLFAARVLSLIQYGEQTHILVRYRLPMCCE